jgi:type IV pilus assembly protein PilA
MKNLKKNIKGFTLIELIVVIAILGILMAIFIPKFTNARERAEHIAFDVQVKELYNAAVLFTIDYPHTAAEWHPFAGDKPDPERKYTDENYRDYWALYITEYPQDPTRSKGNTFTVDIEENGEITILPDTYGE